MNLLKTLISTATLALATATPSFAVMEKSASQPAGSNSKDAALSVAPAGAAAMTDGEIRKVDKEARKLTIKHGAITNLDMPGMTMVFQVKDPAVLDKLKAGDKIRFRAEMIGGHVVVTDLQMTP